MTSSTSSTSRIDKRASRFAEIMQNLPLIAHRVLEAHQSADDHLAVVLCQSEREWIVWTYNFQDHGFHHGDYCQTVGEASDALEAKLGRYIR
jgi:hypothetical protein